MRWQAYSNNLRADPDVCLYYNLQNDLGNNTLTNMASGSGVNIAPNALDGQIHYWTGAVDLWPAYGSAQLTPVSAQAGRFKNKPAMTFNGANDFVELSSGMGKIANLLKKSQQISIATWVGNPVAANCTLFYWPTITGGLGISIYLPFTGNNVYWNAGTTNGSLEQVYASFTAGPASSGQWSLWVFTKTAGPGGGVHIYKNGAEIPYTTQWGSPPLALLDETALVAQNYNLSSARIGSLSGGAFFTGAMDEFCMWDRELTAAEVRQMYDMGTN